jgi:hypothetical protein
VRVPNKFTDAEKRYATIAAQSDLNRPLVLTRCQAAVMCGISTQTLDAWVRKSVLPPPLPGTRRWSRVAIERALIGELVTPPADIHSSPFEEWKRSNAH